MEHPTEKAKSSPVAALLAGAILLFAASKACGYCAGGSDGSGPATEAPATATEARIKDQFSAWDGSHKKLEEWVKSRLNDPDSYEHVETRHDVPSADGTMHVSLKFRAKNAFNATITKTATATVDLDGNFIGDPVMF